MIRGRNSDPQHVEWVVEQLDGVRQGNVVAFTRPGLDTEELVVAMEANGDPPDDSLAVRVRQRVNQALQLSVADVVTLERGQLPKTSSGKVQRQRVRSWYLSRYQREPRVSSPARSGIGRTGWRHGWTGWSGRGGPSWLAGSCCWRWPRSARSG